MNRQLMLGLDQRLLATLAAAVIFLSVIYSLGANQSPPEGKPASLIRFNQTGASCSSPNAGGVSYDLEKKADSQLITVTGALTTSNPCYTVQGSLEAKENEPLALKVVSKSKGGMCVQCVGQVSYQAEIETGLEVSKLAVYHDGQQMKELTWSNSD